MESLQSHLCAWLSHRLSCDGTHCFSWNWPTPRDHVYKRKQVQWKLSPISAPPHPPPPLNVMLILWGWALLSLSLPTHPTPQPFSVAGGCGGAHQATWVLKVRPVHSTIGRIHRTTGWMLKANSYTSSDWCWHFGAVFHAKGSIHRGRSKFHTSKVDLLYMADAANFDFSAYLFITQANQMWLFWSTSSTGMKIMGLTSIQVFESKLEL